MKVVVMKRCASHYYAKVGLGLVVGAFAMFSPHARASAFEEEAKTRVRQAYDSARADYLLGRYCDAAETFVLALNAIPVPVLALWAARSSAKCGDLTGAVALYTRGMQLTENDLWTGVKQQRALVECADELAALKPRVPRLIVRVTQPDAAEISVTLDGMAVAKEQWGTELAVNPGRHVIMYKQGEQVTTTEIDIKERKLLVVELPAPAATDAKATPVPVPAPTPTPRRNLIVRAEKQAPEPQSARRPVLPQRRYKTATSVAFIVGGAGLTAGVVTRLVALSQKSTIDAHCDSSKACDKTGMDAVATANSLQIQSTIYLLLGAAGVTTGVGLVLAGGEKPASPRAQLTTLPVAGGTGLNLEGSF